MSTPPSPGAAKARVRAEIRAQRRADVGARSHDADRLAASADELAEWATGAASALGQRRPVIAAYLAASFEPDPLPSMTRWHEAGLGVMVPLSLPQRRLAWAWWTPETIVGHGQLAPVPEPVGAQPADPAEASLIVVPALAVSRAGLRLGQGGGFYDTFLEAHPAPRVACVREGEVLDEVPHESWDARVDAAWTPAALVRLPTLAAPSAPARVD